MGTISLPGLLLTANTTGVLRVCMELYEAHDPVVCDAEAVVAAEPMALSVLAATLFKMQKNGRDVRVVGLSPTLRDQLARLDILTNSLYIAEKPPRRPDRLGDLHAYRIETVRQGNSAGNTLAQSIAELIPLPYPADVTSNDIKRVHPVVRPLAYIFTELIDNAFSHGRGRNFTHAMVWVSAQYHRPLGRIRLAVVDDGCGFRSTFQNRMDLRVKTHSDAIRIAFRPYVSSKRDVGLFADSQHQGLGLTFCRDIACRAEGSICVATGNAWLTNPGLEKKEDARSCPFWQGSIVALELQLHCLNTVNFLEITARYNANPDLPVRFI